MRKIILDTNVIIKSPQLLGIRLPDTTFVLLIDVISELNSNKSLGLVSQRSAILDKAIEEGIVEVFNNTLPKIREFEKYIPHSGLSDTDLSLIASCLFFIDEGYDVNLATNDREVITVSDHLKIQILRPFEIDMMVLEAQFTGSIKQSEILAEVKDFQKKENKQLIWQLLIGVLISFLGFFIGEFFNKIISTIHVWGIIFLLFIFALGLFYWRERRKFSYGIFEFLIGLAAIIIALTTAKFNYSNIIKSPDVDMKIIGGLYIMVRGQDNIVKSLKGTKFGVFLSEKLSIGT